jgi:hypothetical protein
MGVYASSSEQVLLGLLWAVRDVCDNVSEPLLEEIFREFQARRGLALYGPVQTPDAAAIHDELDRDLAGLQSRGMITRSVNPHARITFLGAPVAASLRLGPPLDDLIAIARDRLAVAA